MGKKSKKKKGQKVENKKTYGDLPKREVREIVQIQVHYRVGHFVVAKKGVMDPDYGIEIGGWKGKIYDIGNGADPLLDIEWDDETLNNSFERATKAIVFFNKYFPTDVAKVNDITILNKVFESFDGNLFKHEEYFDRAPIKTIDSEKIINELTDAVSSINDPMEKLKSAVRLLEQRSKEPFPEVERLLIYFYEEGISGLETTLKTRETIALEHWKGNKDYSFSDLVQKIVPKMPPIGLK